MNNLAEAAIKSAYEEKENLFAFLRDLISIPSMDSNEGKVICRIEQEMRLAGFDEVYIDPMGNIIGRIGSGGKTIAFDAHVDTVETGVMEHWSFDPFKGHEDETKIYGRGSCDQKGGLAAMVYAGKILKRLPAQNNVTFLAVGSVQEENCEGLCWKHIIETGGIRPDAVISTEPTGLNINIGHRGRMDIKVFVKGKSAHGAMPWLGTNAVCRMAEIVLDIEKLANDLACDDFLGKGSLTISEVSSDSPSKCAVPDYCEISIDRRLTFGETKEKALEEVRNLPSVRAYNAQVYMDKYKSLSWKGLDMQSECYFPAWKMEKEHPLCRLANLASGTVLGGKTEFSRWNFSTNGASIKGIYDIPCLGIGPGHEEQAHTPDEFTYKDELVKAAAIYALIAAMYS